MKISRYIAVVVGTLPFDQAHVEQLVPQCDWVTERQARLIRSHMKRCSEACFLVADLDLPETRTLLVELAAMPNDLAASICLIGISNYQFGLESKDTEADMCLHEIGYASPSIVIRHIYRNLVEMVHVHTEDKSVSPGNALMHDVCAKVDMLIRNPGERRNPTFLEVYERLAESSRKHPELQEKVSAFLTAIRKFGTERIEMHQPESQNLHCHNPTDDFLTFQASLEEVFQEICEMHDSEDARLPGISTGLTDLDDITNGLCSGDLIVISGRPRMGKLALAMNMVEQAAVAGGPPAIVFSNKLGHKQLTTRLLCSVGRFDYQQLEAGALDDDEWSRLSLALKENHIRPIFINERAFALGKLLTDAREMFGRFGRIGIIVIDTLQNLVASKTSEDWIVEVSGICRELKQLARELGCPVVVTSTSSRSVENRHDKTPRFSDLCEFGSLVDIADLILAPYVDRTPSPEDPAVDSIHVLKNKHGETGVVLVQLQPGKYRFDNFGVPY